VPRIEGELQIEGIVSVPLSKPYSLSGETSESGPLRENIRLDSISKELGLRLRPFVVLETTSGMDGLVRDWPAPASGADVNRAYALQWYVMALVAFGFWAAINLKKKTDTHE
jgi:cytochrome oxidase assembly protein ShyY1